MDLETAQLLVEVSENAGNSAHLTTEYFGRGMQDKFTVGVVVESPVLLISDLLQYFSENIDGENYNGMKVPSTESLRIDSMGKGFIIY